MKTSLSILFLSFFIIQNSFGQTSPQLYKTILSQNDVSPAEFRTHYIEEYKYNDSGEKTEETRRYYNQAGQLLNWVGDFYEYDGNGNVTRETSRRYNSDVGVWITIEWLDYVYNSNGCAIQKNKIENLGGLFSTHEYVRNENCQITQETLYTKLVTANDIRLSSVREITYLQDGISYQEKKYNASFATGNLSLKSTYEYQFNSAEKVESVYAEVHYNLGGYWYESLQEYTYDGQGNVSKRATSLKEEPTAAWELSREYIYINEYDDKDRLIKKNSERYNYPVGGGLPELDEDSGTENRFDHFCTDLVDRKETNYGVGTVTYRLDSFYEGEDECFEVENILLEMSVFPNPSSGDVSIQSPILQSGNTQILVFDMTGKLLLGKIEIQREGKAELDLGGLPNGMYVIQLMSQEHFVQERVVVSK